MKNLDVSIKAARNSKNSDLVKYLDAHAEDLFTSEASSESERTKLMEEINAGLAVQFFFSFSRQKSVSSNNTDVFKIAALEAGTKS